MEAFEKIQLSFKCPKALNELQPCQSNWYCDGCQKMVHDFRGMEEQQILEVFKQSGHKLCGIYDADRIKVLPQKPVWHKWAAVMALGVTILNGCGVGQQKDMALGKVKTTRQMVNKNILIGEPIADTDTLAVRKHKKVVHKTKS